MCIRDRYVIALYVNKCLAKKRLLWYAAIPLPLFLLLHNPEIGRIAISFLPKTVS